MPLTWDKIYDIVGKPVIFLTVWDQRQQKMIEFTDLDLPATAHEQLLTWITNHLGNVDKT